MPTPAHSLEDQTREHRQEIIALLRKHTPQQVARQLEKQGWTWEAACYSVRKIELAHNPAGLMDGPVRNQAIRDQLQARVGLGAFLFVGGLIVSIVSLAIAMRGGGGVLAYGAVIFGGALLFQSYPQLKRYPDRRLPVYSPPRDRRAAHAPTDF